MERWPTREDALRILDEWMKSANLRKHALAVEAAMRAYAVRFDQDVEKWSVTGLLHDFDYERYPTLENHPFAGVKYLSEHGYAEDLRRAILAHAEHTGEPRDNLLKQTLCAVDELTGLIVAVALVRPTKKLADVTVPAIMGKWNEKRFAAGVDRAAIERGAQELGLPLEEHVQVVLSAMQEISGELGL